MKWAAAILGAVLGFVVGWYALAMGSHAGDAWPTLVFCGPVYLFATLLGDNLGYVGVLLIGTALLYGAYGFFLFHFRRWSVLLAVVVIHLPFVLLAIRSLNSN